MSLTPLTSVIFVDQLRLNQNRTYHVTFLFMSVVSVSAHFLPREKLHPSSCAEPQWRHHGCGLCHCRCGVICFAAGVPEAVQEERVLPAAPVSSAHILSISQHALDIMYKLKYKLNFCFMATRILGLRWARS